MRIISLFLAIIFLCNSVGYASMSCCKNYTSEIVTKTDTATINCHSDNTDNQTNNTDKKQCDMSQCNMCVKPILLNTYLYAVFIASDYFIPSHNILISNLSIVLEQPPQKLFA